MQKTHGKSKKRIKQTKLGQSVSQFRPTSNSLAGAIALHQAGDSSGALKLLDKTIAINPGFAEAYNNRAGILFQLRRYAEALENYDNAVAIEPNYAQAFINRGVTLFELARYADAVASYDRSIAIDSQNAKAHFNRGSILLKLKQYDEALASFNNVIAIDANHAKAYYNRGVALFRQMRYREAIRDYDNAITIDSQYAEAHLGKGLIRLALGEYEEGFELNEWRWKIAGANLSGGRTFTKPLWLGQASLSGLTILLHAEQGIGDTIHFCRFVPMVAALGAQVILEVQEPLVKLLTGLVGVAQCIAQGSPLPPFDYHCPLLSLPLAFKTTLDSIPTPNRYLASDPTKIKKWLVRLGVRTNPRVGLVWSGGKIHKDDSNRSIALKDLLPWLPGELQYFCLQKEVSEVDRQIVQSYTNILQFSDEITDLSDTAALCDLMDVVVSVDTSVAHLSGALGRPTWILLPFIPDWRWLLNRQDSPWYSSARLYRQVKAEDWSPVFERLKLDLEQMPCTTDG